MRVLITAGPSSEPIDSVRTITNRSTGELGATLAKRFIDREHQVEIFLGEGATQSIASAIRFQTNADLQRALISVSQPDKVDLFLHTAALTDFRVDAVQVDGRDIAVGKLDSSVESVQLVLKRQPKLISQLRSLFPRALIVGWKFEVAVTVSELLADHRLVAAVSAHSCPMQRYVPKPPDWVCRRSIWAMASSTVPMTAMPEALSASTSDSKLVVSGAIGRAATRWK